MLSRLAMRGATVQAAELAITSEPGRYPYLETWQDVLESGKFSSGPTRDLVSCRYLLEHCRDPKAGLRALLNLTASDGLVMVEVPDSAKFLAAGDIAFPWEEHVCYFTERTLLALCAACRCEVIEFVRYPGLLEDALVVVVKRGASQEVSLPREKLLDAYRDQYVSKRDRLRAVLKAGAEAGGLALFGVGHQAIMFANAFGVADLFTHVVDDDANKKGTIAPGFRVPVKGSRDLLEETNVRLCLLAVSPRVEDKIKGLLEPLQKRGCSFHSIFAGVQDLCTDCEDCIVAIVQKSPEVFLAEGPISELGKDALELLREAVKKTPRRRARINAHPGSDDALHEMIIALEPGSYIRPHKHPAKSESFHIIEGAVDIVVFDDEGEIIKIVPLSALGGEGSFFYRMSEPFFHTLLIKSDLLIVHEITNGPFRPEGTVFADFAPAETDSVSAQAYIDSVRARAAQIAGASR